MSKAFTKETDADSDDDLADEPAPLPAGVRNYMTPQGFRRFQDELQALAKVERPKVVETVAWAAGNGDRSENGDYIYGKRRLREIDRRIRFLSKRLEAAHIVDPARQQALDQVFFGATVRYRTGHGAERTVTLVGIDEADLGARPGELDRADRAGAAQGAGGRHGGATEPWRAGADRGARDQLSRRLSVPI